ncbi:hypothetical protein DPY74_09890 [Salmonella enterica subsp. salamae]|nr:hypothetical protein [Salmonella enterica subsp. salamae]
MFRTAYEEMVENRGGLPYRINWGAGLRVYLIQDGDEIVILLCAGFKDRQNESFNIIYIMRTYHVTAKL